MTGPVPAPASPPLDPTHQPLRFFGDALRAALRDRVIGSITVLPEEHLVPDETVKMFVRDPDGRAFAFAVGSSRADPDTVNRNVTRARAAKAALPEELGAAVVAPLAEGRVDGVSWAIFPCFTALGEGRLDRVAQFMVLSPAVFDWLYRAVAATAVKVAPEALQAAFVAPLTHIVDRKEAPSPVRAAAEHALDRLRRLIWIPRHALMHGDCWRGNIMLDLAGVAEGRARPPGVPFIFIDWPASLVRGYPMYDLVRLGGSFKIGRVALAREVERHCQALRCDRQDARSYLLASLGYLGMTQTHMPFAETVRACQQAMDAALGA